jgi:Domain of unknown function (DUF4384)
MSPAGGHVGELALRRWRAGEALGHDAEAHVAGCAECRARGKGLDDEQRRFTQEISFDRFAAGVERAARGARASRGRTRVGAWARRPWVLSLAGVAAAAALALIAVPRDGSWTRERAGEPAWNRTKGGAGIVVRVAGRDGTQRTAADGAPESLARGERVRIGYEPGRHRYLLSLSIDDRGQVTPLYPEAGSSVAVGAAGGGPPPPVYLPDSVEFTDPGVERLIVLLSDQPLEVEAARRAARAAYERAKGDVLHLDPLALPGEQFQRTFVKH